MRIHALSLPDTEVFGYHPGDGTEAVRMLVVARFTLLLALPAALALAGGGARAQTFRAPENLSQSSNNSFLPSLVIVRGGLQDGEVDVFWHDFTSAPNLGWWTQGTGGAWTAAAPCPANVTASWTPRAAAGPGGHLHLAWRDRTAGQDDIFYSSWDGFAWSTPVNISLTSGRSADPAIAVDPAGNPHVVWEDDTTGAVRFWEAHFDGTSWSAASDTGLPFLQAAYIDVLRLASDSTGTLHAVWHDGATSLTEIYHAERPPAGSWSAPENVSASPGELSAEPALAFAPDDTLHLAWVEQDAANATVFEVVHATRPSGGSWSAPVNVSAQGAQTFRPSVAVGGDGVARIAWNYLGPGGDEVFFASAPGATPVNVSLTPADKSQRPSLALDANDEPHVAWQEQVGGTNWEVFHATTATPVTGPIDLRVLKDTAAGDVVLRWTGGGAPFTVRRGEAPDPALGWVELTTPPGTASRTWIDAGVVGDGRNLFYLVE